MRLTSPPPSMCLVPSPWHVEHMASGSGFLSLTDGRPWRFPTKAWTRSVWQSPHLGSSDAEAAAGAGAAGAGAGVAALGGGAGVGVGSGPRPPANTKPAASTATAKAGDARRLVTPSLLPDRNRSRGGCDPP